MDSYSEQVDVDQQQQMYGASGGGDGYAEQQAPSGYGAVVQDPSGGQHQQRDPNEIRTIFCTGIANDATQRELYLLFSRYHGYVGCRLQHSGNNRPPVAFVQYETKESCEQAISGLNGFRFDPEDVVQLRLEMAKSNSRIAHHSGGKRDRDGGGPLRSPKQPRMGGPPAGYGPDGYSQGGYGGGAPQMGGYGGGAPPQDYGMAPPPMGYGGGMNGGGGQMGGQVGGQMGMPGGYGGGMDPAAGGYGGGYGAPPAAPMGLPQGGPGGYGGGMDVPPGMGYGGMPDVGGYGPQGGRGGGGGGMGGRGGGGGGRGFGGGNPPCETLFIANIPNGAAEKDLTELFSRLNGYVKMRFSAPPGKSPNAWVDFADVESSTEAMDRMQGMKLGGADSGIRIEFAKSRMGRRPY